MKRASKIPVTIITGFLGAGKTTFINQLLEQNSELKFALVENEFGDVAIDPILIKGVDASQMFELRQGCICCTISDEYELVLQELAERFPDLEHLLIETTGVADPAPVISPFFADNKLKEDFTYNGTICLVDAIYFDDQPEKEISLKQIAVADVVLVNKSEWLSDPEKKKKEEEISRLNPFAKFYFTDFGKTNDLQLLSIQNKIRTQFDYLSFSSNHSVIQTRLIEFVTPITKAEFERWFSYLLDINKKLIYRCKGILYFEGEPVEYILQGVGGRFELTEAGLVPVPGESKLVLIGKLEGLVL